MTATPPALDASPRPPLQQRHADRHQADAAMWLETLRYHRVKAAKRALLADILSGSTVPDEVRRVRRAETRAKALAEFHADLAAIAGAEAGDVVTLYAAAGWSPWAGIGFDG